MRLGRWSLHPFIVVSIVSIAYDVVLPLISLNEIVRAWPIELTVRHALLSLAGPFTIFFVGELPSNVFEPSSVVDIALFSALTLCLLGTQIVRCFRATPLINRLAWLGAVGWHLFGKGFALISV